MPGHLFAIEGCDGSGKTTTAKLVVDTLCQTGHDAVYFREPTSESGAGKIVRHYLENQINIDPNELLPLFITDRVYDVTHNINPALAKGKLVVMDRYYISNCVYEHTERNPWQTTMKTNRKLFPEPEIIFILNPGLKVCKERLNTRGGAKSQYETHEELSRTNELYMEITREDDGNYIIVTNLGTPVEVSAEIVGNILD
jgi:thymidylate kinase